MQLHNKLRLLPQMNDSEMIQAVEAAAVLGFYSESAKFPIASTDGELKVPADLTQLQDYLPPELIADSADTPPDFHSSTKHAKPVPDMDTRKKKGLERLFSKGEFLKDRNLDLLPDCMDFHIVLPDGCDLSTLTAACNLAFRFGMETTSYEGPITAQEGTEGNLLILRKDDICGLKLEQKGNNLHVILSGSGMELEEFSVYLCEHFPLLKEGRTWTDELISMAGSFALKDLDGQLTALKALSCDGVNADTAFVSPEIEMFRETAEKEFPHITFKNHKDGKKVSEKTWDIPWEVDVFKEKLASVINNKVSSGDRITVLGAVSEDAKVRREMTDSIRKELEGRGAQAEDILILCAYKQGYSWIEDSVLPKLKRAGRIERIDISFCPFLPEGTSEWLDEDGTTPSYNNLKDNDPNKWYDLPIRYLQELYPVEDLIAEVLNVDRDIIYFTAYEGDEDITYRFRAFAEDGKEILSEDYLAAWSERPYMDDFPGMGKVHPSTGYLRVYQNGELLAEEHIATDAERVWDIYQKEVLPSCRRFIEEKTGGHVTGDMQPFFSRLKLKLLASEPDERLSCREDLISSLDALHEDFYFVGSDYFKNYGMEKAGVMLDAPGLILPIIKKAEGPPRFKVTLYDQLSPKPCIMKGDEILAEPTASPEVYIREILWENGLPHIHIETEGISAAAADAWAGLTGKGVLEAPERTGFTGTLTLHACGQTASCRLEALKEPQKDFDIRDIDLMEDRLIGYEDYIRIMEQLKRVPGISVYRTARSYMGREIYAAELIPKAEGYVSRTKRITAHPSEIVNSRHHANEVSSTNSAFMLIKELLTNPDYENLADSLNLVIVPMENVDGTAIHYELQKDNPYWKLHIARFNAVGKEFYHEHFKPDTIHTEAMGLTRLWERFLPDIIVDNHGVPSHEWEQQFSGYTSPSFKGFWLPRSLLYGYFWTVTDEEYRSNYPLNKKLEDVIADAIGAVPEMRAWNQEWMARFEKFAHGWMPKLFPANYYKEMINYWIPFAHDPGHRYPSVRFPWITSCCYTSEVADETAQGDYLNLCARAHLTHDLAAIRMLLNCSCVYETKCRISETETSLCRIRQRPICV